VREVRQRKLRNTTQLRPGEDIPTKRVATRNRKSRVANARSKHHTRRVCLPLALAPCSQNPHTTRSPKTPYIQPHTLINPPIYIYRNSSFFHKSTEPDNLCGGISHVEDQIFPCQRRGPTFDPVRKLLTPDDLEPAVFSSCLSPKSPRSVYVEAVRLFFLPFSWAVRGRVGER